MYQLRDEESCLQRILQLLNRLYTSLYDPSPIIADKSSRPYPFSLHFYSVSNSLSTPLSSVDYTMMTDLQQKGLLKMLPNERTLRMN